MPSSVFTEAYRVFLASMVEARTATGLTQTELAARLQKPQSYISKYERGERRIDVIEFRAIAIGLGLDPEELFREINSKLRAI